MPVHTHWTILAGEAKAISRRLPLEGDACRRMGQERLGLIDRLVLLTTTPRTNTEPSAIGAIFLSWLSLLKGQVDALVVGPFSPTYLRNYQPT